MGKKVNTENSFTPLTLPANDKQLVSYVNQNKVALMENVLTSIEYGISKNLPIVETFSFEGTDFIITINSHTFKENVEQIYDYYIKNEKYELCPRVVRLLEKLTHETQKKPK